MSWPDICPGWREREAIATNKRAAVRLEREWRDYLDRYPGAWIAPEPYETRCRINEYVAAHNRVSGESMDPDQVHALLSDADYRDPYKVNRGALIRLVEDAAAMLRNRESEREAIEERAAILEFEAGFSRPEAERRAYSLRVVETYSG